MLNQGLCVITLFFAQLLHAAPNEPTLRKVDSSSSPNCFISIILPESATTFIPRFATPYFSMEELGQLRFYFDAPPDEYDIWDESIINPYGVRLVDMSDTIKIDLRGYVPPSQKYITSNFGLRKGQFHSGIDLKVHKGDSIYCAFDGQVRVVKYQRRGYGHYVVVRHQNGLETLYAHLDKTFVSSGQTVTAGEALGLGGNTGRSTGYHLHFETRYLGNPIDPNDLYDFNECCVKNEVFLLSATNFEYIKEMEKVRFWTVRQGDTLGKIALNTGVSVSRLCALNSISQKSILRIGQKIRYT